jgi:hypothetical protein
MRNFIILLFVAVVIVGGIFLFTRNSEPIEVELEGDNEAVTNEMPVPEGDTKVEEMIVEEDKTQTIIGSSEGGHDITAYHYGEGDKELLFVGGIHGGYEWNTVLVAYELMDFLAEDDSVIPEGYKVTVIPVLNPDGLDKVVGTTDRFEASEVTATPAETIPGRFNANEVDLNRNFDCDWQASGTWQSKTVSGGTEAFSESESQAIRDYVEEHDIAGALVWYSAAGGVFASNCHNGVSGDTKALTQAYADASGYPASQEYNYYEITGDMVNWLAKEGISAISVLLTTHTDVEWDKNKKGVVAFLEFFSK